MEMEREINNFKLLDRQNRTEVLRYLDTFYKEAENILSGSPLRETLQKQALRDNEKGKGTNEVRR